MIDREISFGVLAAIIGTLLVSSFYFSEPAAKPQDEAASVYAPEDIRHPLHMAEQNAKAKNRNRKAPPPAPADTYDDEVPEAGIDDSDIEQPPAEEPEIE